MSKNIKLTEILKEGLEAISLLLSGIISGAFFFIMLGESFMGITLGALFIILGTFQFKSIINGKVLSQFKSLE